MKREWELDRPAGDGGKQTRRQSLETVWKATGKKPKALKTGRPPEELLYIMQMMKQFDAGGSFIDWQQIAGWQQVTGNKLTPIELDVIRAIYDARNSSQNA
ncbi:MAG: phage tail assembly chaperone [Plesiomonas shigelloides]